jgi:transposase-like protein
MKARLVNESLEPHANVSAIARRHDLRPQQIFTSRRQARASGTRPQRARGDSIHAGHHRSAGGRAEHIDTQGITPLPHRLRMSRRSRSRSVVPLSASVGMRTLAAVIRVTGTAP